MAGTVLYDSNVVGKWNDGTVKTVTTFDDRFPKPFVNGKGFEMHASGNPRLKLDGTGVGTLEADAGHGRVYIDSVNYNAITEYELRFNDDNIDNHTCQTQSRHQAGDPPQNRFGGVHHKIDRKNKVCGLKVEKFHNDHIDGPEVALPKKIDVGQWVKVRLTDTPDQDEKSITVKMEIDFDGSGFVKCVENKFKNLESYMVDKAKFQESSYTWFRLNNEATGSISIKNIKQTSI
ncbi:MAG TPA: hypothetical protein VH481_08990 [Nitrososphaeraceae archaeon]|jgi:hypothetical protein